MQRNAAYGLFSAVEKRRVNMSKPNPTDRLYSRDHEWVKDKGDGTAIIGITDYAQEMLTDIVFVELPQIGKKVAKSEPVAVVESVKSVSDVYAPVGGEVIDVNKKLEDTPELINQDAFGEGWIAKMRLSDAGELKTLLSAADYEQMVKEEKH
jgi:glycine cleavage system H protein